MISGLEMMNFELLHYFHTPPAHIIYKHFIFLPLLVYFSNHIYKTDYEQWRTKVLKSGI